MQRAPDIPCADDITGVDGTRQAVAAVAVTVALLTVLPMPIDLATVASRAGIAAAILGFALLVVSVNL